MTKSKPRRRTNHASNEQRELVTRTQPSQDVVKATFTNLGFLLKDRPNSEVVLRAVYREVMVWRGDRPSDAASRKAAHQWLESLQVAREIAGSDSVAIWIASAAHYYSSRMGVNDVRAMLDTLVALASRVVLERRDAPQFRPSEALHRFALALHSILERNKMERWFSRIFVECAPLLGYPRAKAESAQRQVRRASPGRTNVSVGKPKSERPPPEPDFAMLDTAMASLGTPRRKPSRTLRPRKSKQMSAKK